jgi:hypothetical protein
LQGGASSRVTIPPTFGRIGRLLKKVVLRLGAVVLKANDRDTLWDLTQGISQGISEGISL